MRLALLFLTAGLLLGAGETWSGNWTSSQNGNGGTFRLKLTPEPEMTFTLGDQDVKSKITSSKISGDQFDIEYDFEASGYRLRSHAKGTINGDKLKATYQTKSLEDGTIVDAGTFDAKPLAK